MSDLRSILRRFRQMKKLLSKYISGTVLEVIPSAHKVKVQYDDEYKVTRQLILPIARVFSFTEVDDAPPLLSASTDNKVLPPLPPVAAFVKSPSPSEFKNIIFAHESALRRWFSRHFRRALKERLQLTMVAELDSNLAVPYNIIKGMFHAFDDFFLGNLLGSVSPDDSRVATMQDRAFGMVRTLLQQYSVDFWFAALLLWRKLRAPDTPGGQQLQRQALLLLAEHGRHSCMACLTALEPCDHACCREQFLLLGLSLGALTRDSGFFRVHMSMQARAAAAPAASISAAAAPLPPKPVTWTSFCELRLSVAWPPEAPKRQFVRVSMDSKDGDGFADIASVATKASGSSLRRLVSRFIVMRAGESWFEAIFRDTKDKRDAPDLPTYAESVKQDGHALTLFDLHVLCLCLHLDIWTVAPVWDGLHFPVQLRSAFSAWGVPSSEVAEEQQVPPRMVMFAHVSKFAPLSRCSRDTFVRVSMMLVRTWFRLSRTDLNRAHFVAGLSGGQAVVFSRRQDRTVRLFPALLVGLMRCV